MATKVNGELITCSTQEQKAFYNKKYKGLVWVYAGQEQSVPPSSPLEALLAIDESADCANYPYYQSETPKKRGRPKREESD